MAKTFGVYMIVKNEAKYIIRGITSFLKCADEVVVVDTGSSDDTVKLINELNDSRVRLYSMDWVFDFSAARNKAMSYTTADFILSMDGDEYFDDDLIETFNKLKANDFYGFNYVKLNLENFSEGNSVEIRHGERVAVSKELKPEYRYAVHEKIYCNGTINAYDMSIPEGRIIHTHDGNLWDGFDGYRQIYYNDMCISPEQVKYKKSFHYFYYSFYTMSLADRIASLDSLCNCYNYDSYNENDFDVRIQLYSFENISANVFMACVLSNISNPSENDNRLISNLYNALNVDSDEFLIFSRYILSNYKKTGGFESAIKHMFACYSPVLFKNSRILDYIQITKEFLEKFPDNTQAKNNSLWNENCLIPRINNTTVIIYDDTYMPSVLFYSMKCFKTVLLIKNKRYEKRETNNTIKKIDNIEEGIEIAKENNTQVLLEIRADQPLDSSSFYEKIILPWMNTDDFENDVLKIKLIQ